MHFLIFVNKNNMYKGLLHAHSGLRWIALILILLAIINAAKSQTSGKYLKKDKMINLFAMVFHSQNGLMPLLDTLLIFHGHGAHFLVLHSGLANHSSERIDFILIF